MKHIYFLTEDGTLSKGYITLSAHFAKLGVQLIPTALEQFKQMTKHRKEYQKANKNRVLRFRWFSFLF